MTENLHLLAAFQHADSFFPSGAIAFSWGLEALVTDGLIDGAGSIQAFLEAQIEYRWATSDLPLLQAALAADGALDEIASLDAMLNAMLLSTRLRDGSARCGLALLSVHERLGSETAMTYRRRIRGGNAIGHLPVVQGLLWQGLALTPTIAGAMSAHGLCQSVIGAAVRLGVLSHIDGQLILGRVRPVIAAILGREALSLEQVRAYVPQSEIAAMRHEIQDNRLFAN
jgi:urease accessory protein